MYNQYKNNTDQIINDQKQIIKSLQNKLDKLTNVKHYCLDDVAQEINDSVQHNKYSSKIRKFIDFILNIFTSKSNKDHILLPTIQHTTNVSLCSVFNQKTFPILPTYDAMQQHLYNIDNFLNIKCGNNEIIKLCFSNISQHRLYIKKHSKMHWI